MRPAPDVHQRKHILNLTLRSENTAPDFNLTKLAEMTEGFSGSDLKEVARSAAVACLADLSLSRDSLMSGNPRAQSNGDISESGSGGWFQMFNPFSRASRSSSTAPESESENISSTGGAGEVGLVCPGDSMSLRAISMKDFELAISKAKESRAHCSAPVVLRQRMELD